MEQTALVIELERRCEEPIVLPPPTRTRAVELMAAAILAARHESPGGTPMEDADDDARG